MRSIRGRTFLLLSAILLGAFLVVFWRMNHSPKEKQTRQPAVFVNKSVSAPEGDTAQTNRLSKPSNLLNIVKAADFSEKEKADFAEKFRKELKPAVDKWLLAYKDHIPFESADLSLEKFHSRMGKRILTYTFMPDQDTTVVVRDSSDGKPAMVDYLMSRKAAVALNNLPQSGAVPDLTIPIAREDVIRMVKADSGVEFKPNEVIIRPTAAACALNGGAFVNILPTGKDPNNALNFKIMMVVGADGKLVNYERDPFF